MRHVANTPRIDGYRFGRIVIDGKSYNQDVILLPDRVIERWRRKQGHNLLPDDLGPVLEAEPDLLIVGQGAFGRMKVPEETRQTIEAAGIELIVCPSAEACKTYNKTREQQVTAIALHLTC